MDSSVTQNKTFSSYENDSQRDRKAIQQNALLIILTTTVHWAQPMKEWQDPHLYPVVPKNKLPVNTAQPIS